MKTTITEITETAVYADCNRCAGKGYIGAFQHHKGGACFKCGGAGKMYVRTDIIKTERKMTFGELLAQLESAGFGYIRTNVDESDFISVLFPSDEEVAAVESLVAAL